jgi:ABC-type tungstate transport system substrate-binding protein
VIEVLRQAFGLIGSDGPALRVLIANTLQMAFWSTFLAFVFGMPVAYWIASRDSLARRIGRTLANVGLGLPPVGVGVYWLLLAPPYPPYIGDLTYGRAATVQAVISFPIIVALGATALSGLPGGLVDQARAFGASGWRLAVFRLREAKVGVVAAVIVATGAAIGEVGAITIIFFGGGISPGGTLATQMLYDSATYIGGPDAYLVEHAIVMVAMLLALGLLLTIVQQSGGRSWRDLRPARRATAREVRA